MALTDRSARRNLGVLVFRLAPLALVASAAACHSVGQGPVEKASVLPGDSGPLGTDSGTNASASATTTSSAAPAAPMAEGPLDWGTRASGAGPLYAIADGMCIHGKVFPLENGAIFAYGMNQGPWSRGGATTAELVAEDGLAPLADEGFGKAFGFWAPASIGGKAPDKLWAVVDVSSRMVGASDFFTGGLKAADWKILLPSGAQFGDAGNQRTGNVPVLQLFAAGAYGPGRSLFAQSTQVLTAVGGAESQWSFRVLGEDGAWVATPKVPGADLAQLAVGAPFVRLGTGEVLGISAGQGATKLVRWSPVKAVGDLPLPKPTRTTAKLGAGATRAILEVDGALYVYDGEKLTPSKLAPKLAPGFTFAVAPDDTLYVVLPSRTLLKETVDGTVTEEALPEAGTLSGLERGALWLVAAGKGERGSDALFRRASGKWEAVALPAPPYGNELRGPMKIEGVVAVSADDVYVNVRRVEKGDGWKTPEPFRVIYRTKRPREVMRCRDTRDNGSTGVGLHAWPPSADATCKTPVVVVLADTAAKAPKDYPNLRAKLKGKTELGESLTFVNFDARGTSNLAVLATDFAKAKSLATLVSKSLDLRAEVVCGKPTPTRTFTFDVARGTFAF
jgi:hypothetical protein